MGADLPFGVAGVGGAEGPAVLLELVAAGCFDSDSDEEEDEDRGRVCVVGGFVLCARPPKKLLGPGEAGVALGFNRGISKGR